MNNQEVTWHKLKHSIVESAKSVCGVQRPKATRTRHLVVARRCAEGSEEQEGCIQEVAENATGYITEGRVQESLQRDKECDR